MNQQAARSRHDNGYKLISTYCCKVEGLVGLHPLLSRAGSSAADPQPLQRAREVFVDTTLLSCDGPFTVMRAC